MSLDSEVPELKVIEEEAEIHKQEADKVFA